MNRQWVINASPLISLAKISHVSLLHNMCNQIIIPAGVALEIEQGPENDPATTWLHNEGSSFIKVVEPVLPTVAAWDLGLGESQVISWAYQNPGCEAVLDDRAARNCALSMGIMVRGTLSIILLAKKEGQLSKVEPIFNLLIDAGFRIDSKLLKGALQLANE